MTAPATPVRPAVRRSTAWWGMTLLIFTEATLFAVLLFSYLYLRYSATPAWPPAGVEAPTLRLPVAMTVVLVLSSVPMQLAARRVRSGDWARARLALLVGVVMGVAFVVMQGFEYSHTLSKLSPDDNAYGSMFFTITGLHGVHVVIGILLALWAGVVAASVRTPSAARTVENVVLYWHFVDVVWLFVFTTLYLAVAL